MIKTLKFFLLIFIFLLFTTYNSDRQKNYKSFFFKIENIYIENTNFIDEEKLKKDLNFLKGTSLLFLNEKKIINIFSKYAFISNVRLRKSYPNNIEIKVFEKKPIAIQVLGNEKFYITEKGEKLVFLKSKSYQDLPIIFGDQKNFSSFFEELRKSNFSPIQIKAFYYFDIGRWDIVLKNNKTIKLPKEGYMEILANIDSIINDKNFLRYKIFDYRIKEQLILE